jgi:hypothetical protein
MPPQNRVWRHDRLDLSEQAPPEAVAQFGELSALAVFETEALSCELALRSRFSSRRNAIRSA